MAPSSEWLDSSDDAMINEGGIFCFSIAICISCSEIQFREKGVTWDDCGHSHFGEIGVDGGIGEAKG
jgi:hypothetical protein